MEPIIKKELNIGDKLSKTSGYTIETSLGTLWRSLPKDYILIGKVIDKKKSFYQNNNDVNELTLERTSKNPNGKNLRKNYIVWQLSNGKIIL